MPSGAASAAVGVGAAASDDVERRRLGRAGVAFSEGRVRDRRAASPALPAVAVHLLAACQGLRAWPACEALWMLLWPPPGSAWKRSAEFFPMWPATILPGVSAAGRSSCLIDHCPCAYLVETLTSLTGCWLWCKYRQRAGASAPPFSRASQAPCVGWEWRPLRQQNIASPSAANGESYARVLSLRSDYCTSSDA